MLLNLILTVLVPQLVTEAEKLFPEPKSGDTKHGWVKDFVIDLVGGVEQALHVPAEFTVATPALEDLLDNAIVAAVQKIDP